MGKGDEDAFFSYPPGDPKNQNPKPRCVLIEDGALIVSGDRGRRGRRGVREGAGKGRVYERFQLREERLYLANRR